MNEDQVIRLQCLQLAVETASDNMTHDEILEESKVFYNWIMGGKIIKTVPSNVN